MSQVDTPIDNTHLMEQKRSRSQTFYSGLLIVSIVAVVLCLATIFLYVYLSREEPFTSVLSLLILIAMTITVVFSFLGSWLIVKQRSLPVFVTWNLSNFVLIAIACHFDGGINSPISYFFILPMLYLASGFPFRPTLGNSLFGLVCYAAMVYTTPMPWPKFEILFQTTALIAGLIIAVLNAINRDRLDTALQESQKRLEWAATTDSLTGLLNHQTINAELERENTRASLYGETFSLLAFDIDHFKTINDTYGHPIGDQILQRVAAVLSQCNRQMDRVGRVGGDELLMLVPCTNASQALAIAERINRVVQADNLPVAITLSIGIADSRDGSVDLTTLYQRADQALYQAKYKGRNQIATYNQPAPVDTTITGLTGMPVVHND